jgi:hypothetical protein
METLADELNKNGFARNNPFRTLNYVYSNTLQDGQYSSEARAAAQTLAKYAEKFGSFTIQKIHEISQFLKESKKIEGGSDFCKNWENFILTNTGVQVTPETTPEDLNKIIQFIVVKFSV